MIDFWYKSVSNILNEQDILNIASKSKSTVAIL